jgi:peptide/nickel transport system permease protein
MALIVASLAWLNPTRTIRSQVLTLRERGYVEVAATVRHARAPRSSSARLMPNLLPYLGATLVNAVSAAILASIGLEVLGLGPLEAPTLGHDALLGELQRGDHQRLVVVVDRADRHHRDWCSSACSS